MEKEEILKNAEEVRVILAQIREYKKVIKSKITEFESVRAKEVHPAIKESSRMILMPLTAVYYSMEEIEQMSESLEEILELERTKSE